MAGASRPDVTLDTAEAVRHILQNAEGPVSRGWILERLKKAGRSTNSPRLNRVLRFYADLGLLIDGSRGIQWTHNPDRRMTRGVAAGRRL